MSWLELIHLTPNREGRGGAATFVGVGPASTDPRLTWSGIAMDNLSTKRMDGHLARDALMDWATGGMPEALASSVRAALQGIATTGECRHVASDWILFGEVVT